jgi:NAD(P)-dependent dehydrogenase (short-subunit alcohol dehydrogenase family)
MVRKGELVSVCVCHGEQLMIPSLSVLLLPLLWVSPMGRTPCLGFGRALRGIATDQRSLVCCSYHPTIHLPTPSIPSILRNTAPLILCRRADRIRMASMVSKYASKLQDSRVLILGGTSGMGFCVAEAALESGSHVTISSSRQPKLDAAVSRLRSTYPAHSARIASQVCDLSQPETLEPRLAAVLEAAAAGSKIDHVVYTAGDAVKIIPVAEASIEEIKQTGNVRFYSAMVLAKLAPKFMSPGPASSITLTSGINSHCPSKDWASTAAWGSGVEGLVRGLAVDLAPIRVNVVCPGAVHTELFNDIPEERLQAVLNTFADATLTGRVGMPDELAEAYLYCMRCHFATGSTVMCDGGRALK